MESLTPGKVKEKDIEIRKYREHISITHRKQDQRTGSRAVLENLKSYPKWWAYFSKTPSLKVLHLPKQHHWMGTKYSNAYGRYFSYNHHSCFG